MDNNQNQEGLDGLPLEPWMNQQHLSSVYPSHSADIYNQPMSAQSVHDFMSSRALQTFTTAEPMPRIVGQNSQTVSSSGLQQYGLSSSARLHHPEHLSISHERSAWSHLLSLDPSTAMGSHMSEPQESLRRLPQDTPHVQNTRQEPLLILKGNTKLPTSFENKSLNLPKLHLSLASSSTASIPHDNYSQLSAVNSSRNKMSQQFTQHMSFPMVKTTSKPSAPETLAISNDVSSLESSGSYSPVSPPATDLDQPNISNSGRAAELFLREPHEISSAFPLFSTSDHAEIFNYLAEKADPFSSDFSTQDSYSEPAQPITVSGLFSNPPDMPLDMTTAFGSKVDKGFGSKESDQTVAEIAASSDSVTSDKSPFAQAMLTQAKDSLSEMNAATSLSERNQSQFALPFTSDEKVTKPVKSTPKKSNFYGRDASLFSFVPPSSLSSETQCSTHLSESAKTDTTDSLNLFNSPGEVSSDAVATQEHDKTNNAAEDNCLITSGINLAAHVHTNISHAETVTFPTDPVTKVSACSVNLPVLGCVTSQSHGNDTMVQSLDLKDAVIKLNNNTQETENYDLAHDSLNYVLSSNGSTDFIDATNTDKEHTEESVTHWNQNSELNQTGEDFPSAPVTSKIKNSKRKKRKATGFPAKQRKKPVRKQLQAQQLNVFDDSSMNVESYDHSTHVDIQGVEVSEQQDFENASCSSEVIPVKHKTRQVSKAKASNTDLAPRRSSSRKSKDNAMRLIELQADSNYSGISQLVVEKKSTRKRKIVKPIRALAAGDDLSEFSDEDSTEEDRSDKNDGDYVLDEDEIEALDNDVILKQPTGKKINKEKKLGGLKISIKLSGNASAEIVSGIEDSPTRKKRKTVKKKNLKTKGKNKVKTKKQQDEADVFQEIQNSTKMEENAQDSANSAVTDRVEEAGNSSDTKDRHMSLMEKYFSTANSATVARQTQKKTVSGSKSVVTKKHADSAKSKLGKNLALKSGTLGAKKQGEGGKQKASVKFDLESAGKKDKADKGVAQEDADTGVPKFVCGYCPQRYHNKMELLAHMEAHMVEMERKTESEATSAVDENKKTQAVATNLAVSRDPRSNRSGTSVLISGKPTSSENTPERGKLKSTGDQDKDTDSKLAQDTLKQKFKCGECGEVFESKLSLLDHVRIHTADKPFECDICHKCFTERNFLSAHRKTHVQEKLLRCHMCSKAFVHKADLNLHMQSHPKRSNINSSDKQVVSIKKSFKKSVSEKFDGEDSFSLKKPKSFASALTGEQEMSEKTSDTPAVLVLTRGDGHSVEVKNSSSSGIKTVLIEPRVSIKPLTSSLYSKPNVSGKTNNYLKAVDSTVVSSIVSDDSRAESKNSSGVEHSSEVKLSEVASSNICTCKECPDCVTRFLQSFE